MCPGQNSGWHIQHSFMQNPPKNIWQTQKFPTLHLHVNVALLLEMSGSLHCDKHIQYNINGNESVNIFTLEYSWNNTDQLQLYNTFGLQCNKSHFKGNKIHDSLTDCTTWIFGGKSIINHISQMAMPIKINTGSIIKPNLCWGWPITMNILSETTFCCEGRFER